LRKIICLETNREQFEFKVRGNGSAMGHVIYYKIKLEDAGGKKRKILNSK